MTGGLGELLLRLLTAALLGVDAYVHLHDGSFYDASRGGLISQGTLFRLEGLVAGFVAVGLVLGWWVPVTRWADWVVAFLVAASALAAVLLSRYVDVGAIGPLPDMYEPTWEVPGKLLSAYAEAAAVLCSAIGLALAWSGSAPAARAAR